MERSPLKNLRSSRCTQFGCLNKLDDVLFLVKTSMTFKSSTRRQRHLRRRRVHWRPSSASTDNVRLRLCTSVVCAVYRPRSAAFFVDLADPLFVVGDLERTAAQLADHVLLLTTPAVSAAAARRCRPSTSTLRRQPSWCQLDAQ